jgi:hypothetical protein
MDVSFMLVADYANSTVDGKLYIMGVFSRISAALFPVVHPEMYVVVQLRASRHEYNRRFKLEIKLLDEDAAQIVGLTINAQVPQGERGQAVTMNHIIRLNSVHFLRPGDFEFSVLIDDDLKGIVPLQLTANTPMPKEE